jgi:hypothetical protein
VTDPDPDPRPLVIDVVDSRLLNERAAEGEIRVLVEPLYGCVAVAAALDAGWESVELAPRDVDAPPIPLVSFEQPPAAGQVRCRVRCDDLAAVAAPGMLLGAPVLARPLCSMLASGDHARITFVPATVDDELGSDAWWASGMLIRVLLDELHRDSELTDAAGMAVTLARGAENVAAQLTAGTRWRRHVARGGHPDDLRIAAAVDSLGVVPVIERDGDVLVARAWLP